MNTTRFPTTPHTDVHDKLKDAVRRAVTYEKENSALEATIETLHNDLQAERLEKAHFEGELVSAAQQLEAKARDVQIRSEHARASQRHAESEASALRTRLSTLEVY